MMTDHLFPEVRLDVLAKPFLFRFACFDTSRAGGNDEECGCLDVVSYDSAQNLYSVVCKGKAQIQVLTLILVSYWSFSLSLIIR